MKLQIKFLAILITSGLLAATVVLVLVQRAVHEVIIGGQERTSILLARAAAQDAAAGMKSGRESELLPVLQTLQRRKDAVYVAALDLHGRITAHTTVTETGKTPGDEFTQAALRADAPMIRQTLDRGEPTLLVAVPIWASAPASTAEEFLLSGDAPPGPQERLGTLKLALPLGPALETETGIIREIFMIVLVIGALSIGLILALVRRMLAPIQGMMTGIAAVSAGQFDISVPVLSRDELGQLAGSFNLMSGELARTTVSKEYVEGIVENMYDLLLVTDPQGYIETANRAAAELLGDGGLIGRPLASLFEAPPEAGVVHDVEVVLRTKGGGRTPALFSSSLLRGRDGRLRGYIGVAKDITERKRTEEALLAAKLAAEAASRELETFSYSVAHDLRAPLRAVDGFSQILLADYSGRLDEAGADYLMRIRAGSRRMGRLIDDLLNLSRIARGPMNLADVDLSALAADVGAEQKKAEPGRSVEFLVAPGLKSRGDPNLLRVAIVNLLSNAWKYTAKHPSARIEFGAEPRDGRTVYFVRDDGAGFDMALAKRLFQPFTRLHASADFEGTGIGLATVQRVVARHEGRVWAEAEVERGAVFYFTLWEGKP